MVWDKVSPTPDASPPRLAQHDIFFWFRWTPAPPTKPGHRVDWFHWPNVGLVYDLPLFKSLQFIHGDAKELVEHVFVVLAQ